MRRWFLLTLLPLLCAFGRGASSPGVYVSPSPTTIYATWTSVSAASTTLRCGTSLGVYTLTNVTDPSQASVTSHAAIIAGAVAATIYYCQALSGATVTASFTVTTSVAPTTTPLVSYTLGTPVVPVSGQNTGDIYGNCVSNDNYTYVNTDDTAEWNAGGSHAIRSNMMVGRFTTESPLTGANVNVLANFTSGIGEKAKQYSLYCYNGAIYASYGPLQNATATILLGSYGTMNVTFNHGTTFATYPNPGTASSGGVLPSPNTTTMFGSGTVFGVFSFVNYGPDNGTALPTYRVDNADAYVYLLGTDENYSNGNNLWLARMPLAQLASMNASAIQYYTGAADGSLDAAWSTSIGSAVPVLTNTGELGSSAIQYMPSTGRYVLTTWYYQTPGTTSLSTWQIYEGPHPWGPWTILPNTATSSDQTVWNPQGYYYPIALERSALTATANGAPMTLLTAGDYANGGSGPYYQLTAVPITLNTH
jgi:hypothetical protein